MDACSAGRTIADPAVVWSVLSAVDDRPRWMPNVVLRRMTQRCTDRGVGSLVAAAEAEALA